jgi:hypothetical protein
MSDYDCSPSGLINAITIPPPSRVQCVLWWLDDWGPFFSRWLIISLLAYCALS